MSLNSGQRTTEAENLTFDNYLIVKKIENNEITQSMWH